MLFKNVALRFKRLAYGLRTAPRSWQDNFVQTFVEMDFIGCKSDATVCVHESFQVIVLVYVGELRVFGKSEHPRQIKMRLQAIFLTKEVLRPKVSVSFIFFPDPTLS